MVSCLILYNYAITGMDKSKIMCTILQKEFIEKDVMDDGTVIVYIQDTDKLTVWQAAMDLEMENISVGYGFGDSKKSANKKAEYRLQLILAESNTLEGNEK